MKYFDKEDAITEYEKQLQKKDNEIERLKQDNEYLNKINIELSTLNTSLRSDRDNYKSIIKEVREKLCKYGLVDKKGNFNAYLDTIELKELLEILDKVDKENNNEDN